MSKLTSLQSLIKTVPVWRRRWYLRFYGISLAVLSVAGLWLSDLGYITMRPVSFLVIVPVLSLVTAGWLLSIFEKQLSPYKRRRTPTVSVAPEKPELVLTRTGQRINSAPAVVYALRLYSIGLLGAAIGFFIAISIVDVEDADLQAWHIVFWFALAIIGSWLPAWPVIRLRPHVIADHTGLDVVVHPFFDNEAAKDLYAAEGYGDDNLPRVIDFMARADIPWAEAKYFKIEKKRMLYRLRLVLHGRTSVFICSRYSRKKIEAIQHQLEACRRSATIDGI
jgi:hypothetical protein